MKKLFKVVSGKGRKVNPEIPGWHKVSLGGFFEDKMWAKQFRDYCECNWPKDGPYEVKRGPDHIGGES